MGTRSVLQLCETESSSHKMLHADPYHKCSIRICTEYFDVLSMSF